MNWWLGAGIAMWVGLIGCICFSSLDTEKLNKSRMEYCLSLNERTVAMVTLDGQFACVPTLTRIP